MSINGVSQVSTTPVNYAGALTPDALMAYCASRLRGLDEQMQTQFAKQQQYRSGAASLNKLQADLAHLADGINSHSGNKNDGIKPGDGWEGTIDAEFRDTLASMPDGPAKQEVMRQYQEFKNTAGDHDLSPEECRNLAKALGDISKDMSSSAELDMINLQSMMSQRQLAIQMCTQMVSALGESSKSIAAQIGK